MNAPNPSLQVEVFESGLVVKHPDGHWISYARPADPGTQLQTQLHEQSRHRNAGAEASFDRFLREAAIAASRTALRMNWIGVDSAA